MDPKHNLNPGARSKGRCYQEKHTDGYVFPDEYLELEAHDRTTTALPEVQQQFAQEVFKLGKPTVIVLMNAGAIAMDPVLKAAAHAQVAFIEAFYPGPRGGEALAQGIFGLHNRWGRMPYTMYPASFDSEADMTEHDLRVSPGRTYRYYRNPIYSFGQGLTLTNFSIRMAGALPSCLTSLRSDHASQACKVNLQVTNQGSRTGDAVVMAYWKKDQVADTQRRREDGKILLSPLKQLFDFVRVSDVEAGATV